MARKRLLAVWAHPDDEAFGPVGTMRLARDHGWETALITATRGDAGQSERAHLAPGQTLGDVRETELRAACAVLGVSEVHVWRYVDGGVQNVAADALVAEIYAVMRAWQPTVVVTFGPDGITGHPDHIAVGAATEQAFHQLREELAPHGPQRLYYATVRPGRVIKHPMGDAPPPKPPTTLIDVSRYESVKRQALACQESQRGEWESMLADHDWLTTDRFFRAYPPFAAAEQPETTIFDE